MAASGSFVLTVRGRGLEIRHGVGRGVVVICFRRKLVAQTIGFGLTEIGVVLDVRDFEEEPAERVAAQPRLRESGSRTPATAIAAIDEPQQRGEDVAAVLCISGEGAQAGVFVPITETNTRWYSLVLSVTGWYSVTGVTHSTRNTQFTTFYSCYC